jgi:hypothetical protein
MPFDGRRIQVSITKRFANSLRVLGYEPDGDPNAGVEPAGATQVSAAIARYADAVDRAGRELARLLTRPEWNMIADLLNGCADLWDYTETPMDPMYLILAQIEDGQRLDGAGDKWLGDELKRGSGDKKTGELMAKLRGLTQIHGDAILAAARYFWTNHETIDFREHPWWSVEYRTRERSRATRKGKR